MKNTETLRYCC